MSSLEVVGACSLVALGSAAFVAVCYFVSRILDWKAEYDLERRVWRRCDKVRSDQLYNLFDRIEKLEKKEP